MSAGRHPDGLLRDAAERFGTPCYVYFADRIADRITALEQAFGGALSLSYAVKSNPNPAVLAWLTGKIGHLDVSSIGEFRLALAAGWDPSKITFTGPGKRDAEIVEAVVGGIGAIVLESLRDAVVADRCAKICGRIQPVLLRISPDRVPRGFGDHMAGRPCPFGVDIEDASEVIARILELSGLHLQGFHIFSGTQCLKADAVVENYGIALSIFEQLCDTHNLTPEMLIMGSGLGVPYHPQDEPVSLAEVALGSRDVLSRFQARDRFRDSRLVLELGRYLVAESGYFVTRVTATKRSRGTRFAICDGGMNNHLPASGHFGMVIRRNYTMHKLDAIGPVEPVDIVGPLCTSIDRLATAVELPRVEEGDLIAIHNSGAYGLTASPLHFISHPVPHEVWVEQGAPSEISRDFGGAAMSGRSDRQELLDAAE